PSRIHPLPLHDALPIWTMFLNDVEEVLYGQLRKHGEISHSRLPYAIYVQGVQGRKLKGCLFKRRNLESLHWDIVASAREADLHRSEEHTSELQSPCNLV